MKTRIQKTFCWFLLLILCLLLSGCRTRTTVAGWNSAVLRDESSSSLNTSGSGMPENSAEPSDNPEPEIREKNGESGDRTKENPEAPRKEYDEHAAAEIVPGTDRKLHDKGDGSGASVPAEEAPDHVNRLNEQAEEAAVLTVAAEQAEQAGVSEEAAEADSAATYFTVLLQERTGSLFECQRLYAYWETPEDRRTVFKSSPEHSLILSAGSYDVSSRLLEENLYVDDGWICRKNPGIIVKIVSRSILGSGVSSAGAAERIRIGLLSREGWSGIDAVRNRKLLLLSEELLEAPYLQLAAALILAKTAYPDLFTDVDPGQALEMLSRENTGSSPSGIYYYTGQGGF